MAIVIAHLDKIKDLKKAKKNNCFIIHRLDEHFEKNEMGSRKEKHEKIIELNQFADITVFQSQFVFNNVYPFIKPEKYKIIHNGADPSLFYPGKTSGSFIGHVTWGIDKKKRLDILYEFIKNHPEEQFLLIGRQGESEFEFNMPNVQCVGKIHPAKLPEYFRKMKMLYFPSENDPCPNTVVESILSGVPVCYNPVGGSIELVKGFPAVSEFKKMGNQRIENECGLPLYRVDEMMNNLGQYRKSCSTRSDLHFDKVFEQYLKY